MPMTRRRLVIVESPYAPGFPRPVWTEGSGEGFIEFRQRMMAWDNERYRHRQYLRAALRHSLFIGEAPFASHAIYTQPGVLDDTNPEERRMGIEAGFAWRERADATVVYEDLGISPGMYQGIAHAVSLGPKHELERRKIEGWK